MNPNRPDPTRPDPARPRGAHPPPGARPDGARPDGARRLHVDWTSCAARGLCTELLPELLGRDVWGYPVPHPGRDPVVPEPLLAAAEMAVNRCPRLALRLIPVAHE
jgi:ferredoxin